MFPAFPASADTLQTSVSTRNYSTSFKTPRPLFAQAESDTDAGAGPGADLFGFPDGFGGTVGVRNVFDTRTFGGDVEAEIDGDTETVDQEAEVEVPVADTGLKKTAGDTGKSELVSDTVSPEVTPGTAPTTVDKKKSDTGGVGPQPAADTADLKSDTVDSGTARDTGQVGSIFNPRRFEATPDTRGSGVVMDTVPVDKISDSDSDAPELQSVLSGETLSVETIFDTEAVDGETDTGAVKTAASKESTADTGAGLDTEAAAPASDTGAVETTADTDAAESEGDEVQLGDHFLQDEGVVAADLPGKSELNISGRKYIQFDLEHTQYSNPEKDSRTDLIVNQRLQVDVEGSVADDLLEIEINYDDSLPEVERQKTKIKYNGRERDVGFATFQANAKFGDVSLSLPRSRFISYNKQTFGLNGEMHLTDFKTNYLSPRKLSFYGVATQEKGESKRKVFTGKNRRRIPEPVADVEPVRRTYYQPLGDTSVNSRKLPLEVNSEDVYLDDQNEETVDSNTNKDMLVKNGADTYRGDFNLLEPGEDYSINYRTGVIRFFQRIESNYVIAVELTRNDGTVLGEAQPFLIKDEAESDTYDLRYHLENRYRLASQNIAQDDPERVLHIRDQNGNRRHPGGDTHYVKTLGLDGDGDGEIDETHIDFERGEIIFPDTRPFLNENLPETNPTVYGPPSERDRKYEIYQELLVEERSYSLGINVVRESERITVDGEKMQRNRDYTIDYQTGFLRFFDHVDIDEDSEIVVNYETMGFGGKDRSFYGGRLEANLTENLSVGSTLLIDEQNESGEIPQLGQESARILSTEHDLSWQPLHSLQDVLAEWGEFSYFADRPLNNYLELDLDAHYARSRQNPSQEGGALIDDFSGLELETPFSKNHLDWLPADVVRRLPGDTGVLDGRAEVSFEEADASGHEPDPVYEEDQESLRVQMDFQPGDTWAAFQQQFSRHGEDVRGYQYLKFWVKEDLGGTLSVDFGQLTENINRNEINTEDQRDNQVLNSGEDDGFRVSKGEDGYWRFGANNGQLDGEDRNLNGRLDELEKYIEFNGVNKNNNTVSDTTEHGWTLYKIPISSGKLTGNSDRFGRDPSDTPDRAEVLKSARTVRLFYEKAPGESNEVDFLMEEMGVVRANWNIRDKAPDTMVELISSAEDPRLPTPETSKYRHEDVRPLDQAMRLNYRGSVDSGVNRTWLQFPQGSNLKRYRYLQLYFNPSEFGPADTGYIRFGRSQDNYFGYSFSLADPAKDDWVSGVGNGWYRVRLDLKKFEQDLINKLLEASEANYYTSGNRVIKGNPSPVDVSWYEIAVDGKSGATGKGEVLFNYLSLDGTREEVGSASYVGGDLDIRNGLVETDFSRKSKDGEFRSIGQTTRETTDDFVPEDTERKSVSGSVDVNRFIPDPWPVGIPLSFSWYNDSTEIPPDRVERVRNDQLGLVDERYYSYTTGLQTPSAWPGLNFNFSENDKEVRREKDERHWTNIERQWKLDANYSQNFNRSLLGLVPVGQRLSVNSSASLRRKDEKKESLGAEEVSEHDRRERRRKLNLAFGINPYSWVSIDPEYRFSDLYRSSEGRASRAQFLGSKFQFSRFYGLEPQFNFDLEFSENFNDQGEKDVDATGNSGLQLQTNPNRWWERLEFLSIRYNLSISNSATYRNRPRDEQLNKVYSHMFKDLGWLWRGADLSLSNEELSLSRSGASKSINHSFSGDLDLWDPLRTSYNFSRSESYSQSDGSVRVSTTEQVSLDNRISLSKVSGWFENNSDNSSFKLNYSLSLSEDRRKESRDHQLNLAWNTSWNVRWNTNFNLNTKFGRSKDREVTGKNRSISPSLDFKWLINRDDEKMFVWFTNRLELNGGLSADFNYKTSDNETQNDDESYSGNFGGSYNFSENMKSNFSGNFSYYRDNYREARDRFSYGVKGSVDFRF